MRKNKLLIRSFIPLLLVINCTLIQAQVKVQVATQVTNKSINWTPGMSVILNAERAEIFCTTHKSRVIDIELSIISKNEDRKTAESDLKKMKFLNETKGNKLFLRNYIELARNESKPGSALKVIYTIKIPENCAIEIHDYFGKITVKNLRSELKINSEYTQIELNHVEGKINVNTLFGDVNASNLNGQTYIESTRSNISIINFEGLLKLKASVAEIHLTGLEKAKGIRVEAEKSMINLKFINPSDFAFLLQLHQSELTKPEKLVLNYSKNEKDDIKASFNTGGKHPQVNINLNFGTLKIQ